MDNIIAQAKAAKMTTPIQRPFAAPTPAPTKSSEAPEPISTNRGAAVDVEAPEGAPGVQPTLMERSNAESLIPTDPWETSPMFYEIANMFNIEPKFFNAEKDKISVITDWAINQAGSNKIEDIYHVIRQLQDSLVHTDFSEKSHQVIYRYLRLRSHADAANKAVKAFEKVKETH
jgi:hypothetical protein